MNTQFKRILALPYRTLYRNRVRVKIWWQYGRHSDIKVDPFELQWVNPQEITEMVDLPNEMPGAVISGDWDLNRKPISDHSYYQSFVNHFRHDVPWEETEYYNKVMEQLDDGKEAWHQTTSVEGAIERFEGIDGLFRSLESEGYKTQAELEKSPESTSLPVHSMRYPPEIREVRVAIGRDGDLLFVDGAHRLILSTIVGIDKIPVCIWACHQEWKEKRI